MQAQLDRQDVMLTDLRIATARLDEQVKTVIEKLDAAVASRAEVRKELESVQKELNDRLGPVTESMNRWKGALAMIALFVGAVASAVTLFVEHWLAPRP